LIFAGTRLRNVDGQCARLGSITLAAKHVGRGGSLAHDDASGLRGALGHARESACVSLLDQRRLRGHVHRKHIVRGRGDGRVHGCAGSIGYSGV